ncbi:ATP/GTP-binding protein [Streptomyces avermitilis]|uniref:ATP/GTP-binding protein n=3 Tax=Actinomycetes TaxID=1760 RepID=Q82YC3_STRAW|nr:ATP-binding protein [Streptomyces avermitilis]KUN48774.1 ATP/GTP-binding protein [Streptomyces avermitilis]OOV24667.1 ATP/GTP-binding protein [Streptomyces avermitilis]BAC75342.1 putative ATP/GTP-binding protein [Streptomyces avermitilis MA-4680 = NBRC 14893]BBJ56390.1 ATP/GTP-binding protein [Streptomyces avermitilis]GDY70423.1 ATP/GTP-binding protein [Streptomyces avermitilis]
MTVLYPDLPENGLIVLIGASGAGKSTLARTRPASQVLSLDRLRGVVGDDPGRQDATGDAADVLKLILERRMARGLNTVIDATNCEQPIRVELVTAAKRHGMPTVAVIVPTPLSVCLERQHPRPANRRVPQDVVRAQHKAMTYSHQQLAAEGFNTIVFADNLYRLEPLLKRLSERREADLGRDGGKGLGDLLLVRRFFGPAILPLWRWRPGSDLVTGRDRVAEIRLGQQYLTLAYRADVDSEGDFGFDVLLPCPVDPECAGQAWAPVYSVTDLHKALTGAMDSDPDLVCTVHGDGADDDQDDDPEGRADLQAQFADAVA